MKVFIVEYYNRHEGGDGKPIKAFKKREHAEFEAAQLTTERLASGHEMTDHDNQPITDLYRVVEIEVTDSDVKTYAERKKKTEAAIAAQLKAARKEFKNKSKVLFEAHPGLESFGWTQYTPFFNDGETCYFSVHYEEPDINGLGGYGIDSGREWVGGTSIQAREPSLEYQLQEPVAEFLSGFDKRDMKKMFDDHVKVVVHRNGKIETEEYEHS